MMLSAFPTTILGRVHPLFEEAVIDDPIPQVKGASMAARFAACRRLTYRVARRRDAGIEVIARSLLKDALGAGAGERSSS
jgi:hypothetical protein